MGSQQTVGGSPWCPLGIVEFMVWRLDHLVPTHVALCLKDDWRPRGSCQQRFINGVLFLCLAQPIVLGMVMSRLALLFNILNDNIYGKKF